MKQIALTDTRSSICTTVLPDYGGTVSSLSLGGVQILRMKPELIGMASCLAGGIPVLFPFCSKTDGDTYFAHGQAYTMPFHGLVKGMTFGVEEISGQSVRIYTVPNEVILKENYPYDFVLHIEYRVEGKSLYTQAVIENRSDKCMPFYIGWHPYFRTSSKKDTTFTFDMQHYRSYLDGSEGGWPGNTVDLTRALDHVFWGVGKREMTLENRADGYTARIIMDEMHSVATVCTAFDDCVCIEPWTGTPNAVNTGEVLQWVSPHGEVRCGYELAVSLI